MKDIYHFRNILQTIERNSPPACGLTPMLLRQHGFPDEQTLRNACEKERRENMTVAERRNEEMQERLAQAQRDADEARAKAEQIIQTRRILDDEIGKIQTRIIELETEQSEFSANQQAQADYIISLHCQSQSSPQAFSTAAEYLVRMRIHAEFRPAAIAKLKEELQKKQPELAAIK